MGEGCAKRGRMVAMMVIMTNIVSTTMIIVIAMTMMVKYNYVEKFQTKTEDLVGAEQSWIEK